MAGEQVVEAVEHLWKASRKEAVVAAEQCRPPKGDEHRHLPAAVEQLQRVLAAVVEKLQQCWPPGKPSAAG